MITEIVNVNEKDWNTIYKILKKELNYVPYNKWVKEQPQNKAILDENHFGW